MSPSLRRRFIKVHPTIDEDYPTVAPKPVTLSCQDFDVGQSRKHRFLFARWCLHAVFVLSVPISDSGQDAAAVFGHRRTSL